MHYNILLHNFQGETADLRKMNLQVCTHLTANRRAQAPALHGGIFPHDEPCRISLHSSQA